MRGTPRGELEKQRENVPLKNKIFTIELVITGKGEGNDNHSRLAARQSCIQHIELNISSRSP